MIADFEVQCVLGEDQLWRFQSHVLRPIFVGSDVPISLSIDRNTCDRAGRLAGHRKSTVNRRAPAARSTGLAILPRQH